jgi:chromosome partitioning protein
VRLALVNLKGGSAKTTSSLFLAHELAKRGKTLLIDADPQGSALSWSEQVSSRGQELPFDVISLPTKDIHKRLKTLGEAYEHVVIDSPPGHIEIVQSALLSADIALIPLSPSLMEIDRMRPALEVIASVENFKPDLVVHMLFNRVQRNTNSYKMAREYFDKVGFPVLDTVVPRREAYNVAFGARPINTPEYEDVLHELLGEPRKWAHLLDGTGKAPEKKPTPQVKAAEVDKEQAPAAPVSQNPSPTSPVEPSQASVAPAVPVPAPSPPVAVQSPPRAPEVAPETKVDLAPVDTPPPAPEPLVQTAPPAPVPPVATQASAREDAFDPFAEDAPALTPPNAPVRVTEETSSEQPRRRASGSDEELAQFSAADPLQKIFTSDNNDEDARPPHLRGNN